MEDSYKLGDLYYENNEIKISSELKSLKQCRINCAIEMKYFFKEKSIKIISKFIGKFIEFFIYLVFFSGY